MWLCDMKKITRRIQNGNIDKKYKIYQNFSQIFLLVLGTIGILEGFFSMLKPDIDWKAYIIAITIWTGSLFFLFKIKQKKVLWTLIAILFVVYLGAAIYYRDIIGGGLIEAVQEIIQAINQRFKINIILHSVEEIGRKEVTFALIMVSLPETAFLTYGIIKLKRWLIVVLYAQPFIASCVVQAFPNNFSIICMLCTFCAVIVYYDLIEEPDIIQTNFRYRHKKIQQRKRKNKQDTNFDDEIDDQKVFVLEREEEDKKFILERQTIGRKAIGIELFLCIIVLCITYYLLLPRLEKFYEDNKENRYQLYAAINYEILPQLEEVTNWNTWSAWFRNSTVRGNLNREGGFQYTGAKLFKVTTDEMPKEAVYLRGFVGNQYTGDSWEADTDQNLETYYQKQGLKLPKDYADLVNFSYYAAKEAFGQPSKWMEVQELGGSNDYNLYPYRAYLKRGKKIHADGTLEKEENSCSYFYYPMQNYNSSQGNKAANHLDSMDLENNIEGNVEEIYNFEEYKDIQQLYQQYVYNTYLDYPESKLPRLTKLLDGIKVSKVWMTVQQVVGYLGGAAKYNINTPAFPEEEDFTEYFLFEQREGYCAHFATAGVLMLRRLGVPARYVTGYCAAPQDFIRQEDGSYQAVIEDKQAHAWAEVYLDTIGWVPVECTPGNIALEYDNRQQIIDIVAQIEGGKIEDEIKEDKVQTEEVDALEENSNENQPPSQDNVIKSEASQKTKEENTSKTKEDKAKQEAFKRKEFWENVQKIGCLGIVIFFGCLAGIIIWYSFRKKYRRKLLYTRSTNESICYLYRNMKQALSFSGAYQKGRKLFSLREIGQSNIKDKKKKEEKLQAGSKELTEEVIKLCPILSAKEVDTFMQDVVRSSFGEGELPQENLQCAYLIYQKICQQLCRRLPFYKRWIFYYWKGYLF